ncbi:hypothetical protein HA44_14435 [Mixta gaviniae]|nr:hypothetical protein HA44_14435 [Mixta gaviniae]
MRADGAKNGKFRFAALLLIMPRVARFRQISKSIQLDPVQAAINFVVRNNCQLKYQSYRSESMFEVVKV